MVGIFSIMLQILVYIFLEESKAVQITMTCFVVFAILPPIVFLLNVRLEGKRRMQTPLDAVIYMLEFSK